MTQTEFIEAVDAECKDYKSMSPGICSSCDECQSTYGMEHDELEKVVSSGELPNDPSFSWSGCDCCVSPLGHDLYDAHALTHKGEIIHYDICGDCLCYLANGDLPTGE